MSLTPQMRVFAERYVACGNSSRAAEEAGYAHPRKIGSRLAEKPAIKAEVERLRAKLEAKRDPKTIADAEEIQRFLSDVMRGDVTDHELTLSGDPEEIPPKLETRRKAAMDLARLQGLIVNRNEHAGPGGAPIEIKNYQQMSAAELEAEARRLLPPKPTHGERMKK